MGKTKDPAISVREMTLADLEESLLILSDVLLEYMSAGSGEDKNWKAWAEGEIFRNMLRVRTSLEIYKRIRKK